MVGYKSEGDGGDMRVRGVVGDECEGDGEIYE